MPQQLTAERTPTCVGTMVEPEPPDTTAFLRANPGAQQMLRDLAEESGYIVISPTSFVEPSYAPSISQLLHAEMDTLKSRERQLRELRALASCRVGDLKPEQVRRILDAIA